MCDTNAVIFAIQYELEALFNATDTPGDVHVECEVDTPHLRWRLDSALVVVVYAILFLLGVGGCCTTAMRIYLGVRDSILTMSGCMVYITTLCLIDLASTLSIFPLITDELFGVWLFGGALCRIQIVLEWVGKTLNTYMLLAISVERYLAVCRPHQRYPISRYYITTAVLLLLGGAQLVPIFLASGVKLVQHELKAQLSERQINATVVMVEKCEMALTELHMKPYMIWLFTFCFFVPLLFSIACSGLTYMALRQRMVRQRRQQHSGKSSLFLTIFYTVCFLPHWIVTVGVITHDYLSMGALSDPTRAPFDHPSPLLSLVQVLYALPPYLNSSLNWIFYGLLNSQLNKVKLSSVSHRSASTRQRSRQLALKVSRSAENSRYLWRIRHAYAATCRDLTEFSVRLSARPSTASPLYRLGGSMFATSVRSSLTVSSINMDAEGRPMVRQFGSVGGNGDSGSSCRRYTISTEVTTGGGASRFRRLLSPPPPSSTVVTVVVVHNEHAAAVEQTANRPRSQTVANMCQYQRQNSSVRFVNDASDTVRLSVSQTISTGRAPQDV